MKMNKPEYKCKCLGITLGKFLTS
ncbi:hypothetical protein D046_7044B, partial [Vibrio parahaemolyticus V-223/04]